MTEQNRPVVIVDGYTTGNFLPPAFSALGADLVHVQSTPELMTSMLGPDLSRYRANVVNLDLDKTVAELAAYAPVAVLPGQEPGVNLADELAERLGVPTNGTQLSSARRNKFDMIEALRRAGLHCARQFVSGDPEALVGWAEREGVYPVVVKPLSSAATDGVSICHSADDVRVAAKAVLDTPTIYLETNRVTLIQSYLDGTEYVVDMVSYDGRRYVCGVWAYQKRIVGSHHNIYDQEHILPADVSPVPELIAYVDRALDALDIRYGPTHAEVIMTADGPALVEVGARLAGNMHPGFHDLVAGANQVDLTAQAYLQPERFLAEWAGRTYTKRAEAICCTTFTELDGVVDSIDDDVVAEISALDTVYLVNVKIKPGGRIRPTVDLYTSTLRVFMSAPTQDEIQRDYQRLQGLKDRVYRLR